MKEPEHWIPIKTVASFKRMRQFNSHGLEWVTNAIRLSDFLQVDETGTNVRRITEPQPPKNQFERSVYAVRFWIFLKLIKNLL
jgi:lupus La protein